MFKTSSLISLILTLLTYSAHAMVNLEQELKLSPCAEKTRAVLKTWQAEEPWIAAIAHAPGERVLRAPTAKLGKWIEVTISPGQTKLNLFNQNSILAVRMGKDCETEARLEARHIQDRFRNKKSIAGYQILRDEDIAKIFAESGPGVFFLWSPHYEISVEGLRQAQAAAKKAKLPLYALVEPTSNPEAVARIANKLKLDPQHVYYLNSFDLQYRGMRLHFPSLIVFNKGKFTSQVRRGYEDDFVYEEYFKNHLAERQ